MVEADSYRTIGAGLVRRISMRPDCIKSAPVAVVSAASMPGARSLFRGGLRGFGEMLRHALAALHDLLRLLLILVQGGLKIIRIHLMHFRKRRAAHKLT